MMILCGLNKSPLCRERRAPPIGQMGDGRLPDFDTGEYDRLVTIDSNLPERTMESRPQPIF
jgi:hypothetical protein